MTRILILSVLLLTGCATPPRAEVSVEYRVERDEPELVLAAKMTN